MTHVLQKSLVLAALLSLLPAASADIKIKTRTTVMGHSTDTTVYIKGSRERREMNFGPYSSIFINQCDQRRMINISANSCSATQFGGGDETSCPVAPAMPGVGNMAGGMGNAEPESAPPRQGGTITITSTSTDTGERQDMFGFKAKHIRTSMTMEPSPDACNKEHVKIETDGWYANFSAEFSCRDESARTFACGGMGRPGRAQRSCQDRIIMKGGAAAFAAGYPLRQTTTITSDRGTFTTSTEVTDLETVTLDAGLFEMPSGCRLADLSGGKAPVVEAKATPAPASEAAASAPPPAPAATVAPKAAGVVRVGVVKIKDVAGQGLPTDNLRMNLMDEVSHRSLEVIPLDAEAPPQDVEAEARAKQCDYILYTAINQVADPNSGGLPAASVPKGVALGPARYQALNVVNVFKVGRPVAEIKDLHLAADDPQLNVNAIMATFGPESDKLAQQIQDDAHLKPSTAKSPAKKPAAKPK